ERAEKATGGRREGHRRETGQGAHGGTEEAFPAKAARFPGFPGCRTTHGEIGGEPIEAHGGATASTCRRAEGGGRKARRATQRRTEEAAQEHAGHGPRLPGRRRPRRLYRWIWTSRRRRPLPRSALWHKLRWPDRERTEAGQDPRRDRGGEQVKGI